MSDLSFEAAGLALLTPTVSFLYSQAGELIRRWREASDKTAGRPVTPDQLPKLTVPSELFADAPPSALPARPEAVEEVLGELSRLRGRLHAYADGTEDVDPRSASTMAALHELKAALERVYDHDLRMRTQAVTPPANVHHDARQYGGIRAQHIQATNVVAGDMRP